MNFGFTDLSKKSYLGKHVLLKDKIVTQKITFFRKVRETNIHPKSFIKFSHFGI
jgi:hypothetical protein